MLLWDSAAIRKNPFFHPIARYVKYEWGLRWGDGGAWNGAAERRFDLHLARFGGCEVPLLVVVRGI